MGRRAGRLRGERGHGTLEYVGIVVLVASVVVLLTGSALGLDTRLASTVKLVLCQVTGGDCSTSTPQDIEATLPDCEVFNENYTVQGEVTIFSVNAGANGTLTLREVVGKDGKRTYLVDQQVGADLGAHVMAGQKGKLGLGEGLSAEAKLVLTGKGSRTFSFDSEKAARDFIVASASEVGKQGVKHSLPPVVGDVAYWGIGKLTGVHYQEPAQGPAEYFVEGGFKGGAAAEAAAPGLMAGVGAEGSRVLGVKVVPAVVGRDGKTTPERLTFYLKGNGKLNGQLGILGAGPNGTFEGESVVALTYENGRPVEATVESVGKVKSSLVGKGTTGDVVLGAGLPDGSGTLGVDVGATQQGKVTLTLDLQNPENLRAFTDTMNSVGMPVLNGEGTPGYQDPVTAVAALSDRFLKAGPQGGASMTGQLYEGAEGKFQVGFFAGDLVAFGAGGEVSASSGTVTKSVYYDPSRGMVPWRRCGG